ncbi:MAG TPA: hypothetical protein VHT53_02695 [Candidatus Elarobacter sp.]|nr:hypothetical protein [Candidatus Elarobacter sp.]
MVILRFVVLAAALVLPALPAAAADLSQMAPADEYFGHARLSVLGIANTIRDAGARLDEGRPAQPLLDGPLAFANDAIRAWETKFPNDPWIARDLLALEVAYVHAGTPRGMDLARRTEAWLVQDYPGAPEARDARVALRDGRGDGDGSPWERFAAMRAPFPPQ